MSLHAVLAPVTEVIEARLGTSCSGPRAGYITEAVRAGMARAGVRDAIGYAQRLEQDAVVRADLAESLRVCETYFLRERGQLEALSDQVLPTLAARSARTGPLRLWSAGCSSGEEAYSLAIALELAGLPGRARILATDRSAEALAAAERGVYGAWSLRSLDAADRERYFTPALDPGKLEIAGRLRRGIGFREHDLVVDPFPSGLDLIVCRNVLLYLTPEHGAAVVERLATSLARGGWLVLGSADPHHQVASLLERVRTASGALYHRGDGRPARPSPSPAPSSCTGRGGSKARRPRPNTPDSLQAATVDRGTSTGLPSSAPLPQDDGGGQLHRCERALAEEPLEPRHHVLHATLLLEAGRAVSAVRAATAAVFLAPELAPAHVALGRAHLALEETVSAARAFRNARELLADVPDDATVAASSLRAGRLRQVVDAGIRSAGAGRHR